MTGILSSCSKDLEKINIYNDSELLPVESSTSIEIIQSDSAKIKLKIIAPKLNRFVNDSTYLEFPEGIKMYFYNQRGEVESQIQSNYALNYEKSKLLILKNDVAIINKNGEKLNGEHLIFDNTKQSLFTEEFVKITTADEIIFGDGLQANQDFTKYKIKNIKGTIQIKDEEL
jgi:LPS export ABC transporter protein LptC